MFLAKVKNSKVKDGAKMISNVISISCRLDRIKAALQERLRCYVPDSRTTVVTPDIIKNLEGLLISMEDCIRLKKAALDLLACTTSLPYHDKSRLFLTAELNKILDRISTKKVNLTCFEAISHINYIKVCIIRRMNRLWLQKSEPPSVVLDGAVICIQKAIRNVQVTNFRHLTVERFIRLFQDSCDICHFASVAFENEQNNFCFNIMVTAEEYCCSLYNNALLSSAEIQKKLINLKNCILPYTIYLPRGNTQAIDRL